MPRRGKTKNAAPPAATRPSARPSAVQAIFDPAGDILVRAVTPGGTVYEIEPRVAFQIAGEDVDWFFDEWDWQHRQRLVLAKDYRPRQPQFDNGAANLKARVEEPERPAFDNGAASQKARVDEPKRSQFDNGAASLAASQAPQQPEASLPEEPVEEPEETVPDPVEADDGDNEDKE